MIIVYKIFGQLTMLKNTQSKLIKNVLQIRFYTLNEGSTTTTGFFVFFRSKTKNKKLLIWGFLIKWKEEMENKFFETIFAKYHSRIGRISQKGCDFQINKKDAK